MIACNPAKNGLFHGLKGRFVFFCTLLIVAACAGYVFGDGGPGLLSEIRAKASAWKGSPDRAAIEADVLKLVDGVDNTEQVRQLSESMNKGERFRDLVVCKYARMLIHVKKLSDAYKALRECLDEAPRGQFADWARFEIGRLEAFQKVDSRSVGILLPLSGEYGTYGVQIMRAISIAVNGGVTGSIEEGVMRTGDGIYFHLLDTAGISEKAVSSLDELLVKHRVIGVMGPVFSGPAVAAAIRADETGVPIVTLSRKEEITDIGSWVFRNCLTNSAQGDAAAKYAIEKMGMKTFAILYPNIPYGVELANFFWDAVEKYGGVVVGAESYDNDQTTFTNQAKKLVGKFYLDARQAPDAGTPKWAEGLTGYRLKKAMQKQMSMVQPNIDFDLLFIPDYHDKVSLIVPALAAEDVMFSGATETELENALQITGFKKIRTVQLMGGNGWNSTMLVERNGKLVEKAVFIDGFFAGSDAEQTKIFVNRFKELYNREPGLLEAYAYDTARIFIDIIRRLSPLDRASMRKDLLLVKDFPGASGQISFTPEREAKKQLYILTIENGELKEIGRM